MERIQRLENAQERQARERRRELRRATRYHMHYGSEEEKEDWRVQNVGTRGHQHQPSKNPIPFVKLPSFNWDSDPNVYLG